MPPVPDDVIAALAQRSQSANEALVRGGFDAYLAMLRPAADCVLMGPFGGAAAHGYDTSSEGRARMSRQFVDGTFAQEIVSGFASDGLAVLVTLERIHARIAGLAPQPWTLRVTQVFRRDDGDWRLVHRHADPLATAIAPAAGAVLAAGDLREPRSAQFASASFRSSIALSTPASE